MDRFLLVYGHLYYRFVASGVNDGSRYLAGGDHGPYGVSMEIAKLARDRGFGVFLTGSVGDDYHGRQIIASLNQDGISTRFIVVGGVEQTSVMFQIQKNSSQIWCARDSGTEAVHFSRDLEDYHHLCDGVVSVVEGKDTAHLEISRLISSTEIPEYRIQLPQPIESISAAREFTTLRRWRGEDEIMRCEGTIRDLMETIFTAVGGSASGAPAPLIQ